MSSSLLRTCSRGMQTSVKMDRLSTKIRRLSTNNPSQAATQSLTWSKYLDIRRRKRRWETAVTIPCTLLGLAGGVAYFGSMETDATKPIMGVDPLFFYGGCTIACMGTSTLLSCLKKQLTFSEGLGYLVGPIIGSACWRLTHRRTMNLIEAKDREFHKRIVRNRVDPTAQSATNPVPDYYGEKIGSVHEYRQWLRDQAKFRRKARFIEE
ncbi:mitochondrial import protein Pam17 [Scleroderma citrinum]